MTFEIPTKKHNQPEIEFIPKDWGFEKIICNNKLYCGKLLYIAKNRTCSLHYHKIKDETFYVQSGKIALWCGDANKVYNHFHLFGERNLYSQLEKVILTKGDNFYMPPNTAHQMIALEDAELFEFSTQDFKSDSYRILTSKQAQKFIL